MYDNVANIYREKSISTASSEKLLLMLYEGAIKFCRFAEMAIEEKRIEEKHNNLKKVQNILTELTVTLNQDAGEIAGQLDVLYDYMNHQLIEANIENNKNKVVQVRNMLEELQDTWKKIIN